MGYQDRTKNKEWYDGECRDAVERRNALRMQWLLRPTIIEEEENTGSQEVRPRRYVKRKSAVLLMISY